MEKISELVVKEGVIQKIIDVLGLEVLGASFKAKAERIKKISQQKLENELELKNSILNNPGLTIEQKFQVNAMLGVNYKKFIRQMKVLEIAIDNMDEESKTENIDEDWLLDLWDKVSMIENPGMQEVWGKLIAYATKDKNICSKSLLNTLFMMSTDEVNDFRNLLRFCVVEIGCGTDSQCISAYPIIYFSNHVESYQNSKISRMRLNKLESLGLIEVDYKSEYVFFEIGDATKIQ